MNGISVTITDLLVISVKSKTIRRLAVGFGSKPPFGLTHSHSRQHIYTNLISEKEKSRKQFEKIDFLEQGQYSSLIFSSFYSCDESFKNLAKKV